MKDAQAQAQRPYPTTRELLEAVRDMYEPRHQFRHRAGGEADPLVELLRRFPAPGEGRGLG